MDKKKFSRVSESLRKFQRAELKEFEDELGQNPVERVYVDPLEDNAVLNTVLSGNTTFLFGRKGTGKSTIIARAQSEIRKNKNSLTIYLDVKSINESSQTSDVISKMPENTELLFDIIQPHLLRKSFLIEIFTKLIDELESICKQTSMFDRLLGRHQKYEELKSSISALKNSVRTGALNDSELPILQLIEREVKIRHQESAKIKDNSESLLNIGSSNISFNTGVKSEDLEEILDDDEVYDKYAKAILRTFPYQDFLKNLSDLLEELSFSSLNN